MLQEAVAAYTVAGRIFDTKMKRIQADANRKKPAKSIGPYKSLSRINKAESDLKEARYTRLGAVLLSAEADIEVFIGGTGGRERREDRATQAAAAGCAVCTAEETWVEHHAGQI